MMSKKSMSKKSITLIVYGIGIPLTVGVLLGWYWCLWKLYLWVIPPLFPNSTSLLVHPTYWWFLGAMILFMILASVFRSK